MSAWSAMDYDFDWFVYALQYREDPTNAPINNNDELYIEYSELLLQAKEAGLGYRVEHGDTLHLVPTPLAKLNVRNQFHSSHVPAIRWKGGQELFFLNGVQFEKKLWEKIVKREMEMKDIMAIVDIDQRVQAMRYAKNGLRDFYISEKGKKIDNYVKLTPKGQPINYELWNIKGNEVFNREVQFAIYDCPSAIDRGEKLEYSKGVPLECKTISEAMAWGMSNDNHTVTPKQWEDMTPLIDES